MKSNVLVPIVVFVVGFGLGYGLTWVLVGGEPEAAATAVGVGPQAATPATPAESAPADPRPTVPAPVVAELAAPDSPAEPEAADPAEPEDPTDPAAEGDDEVGEPAPVDSPPEPEVPTQWWEACRGQACVADFGGLSGGLSIRKGSLTQGQTVDWARGFGGKARLDILPTDGPKPVELVLHAVGMGADGAPLAALVSWDKGRSVVKGVIKLRVSDRVISLVPPEPE